MKNRPVRNVARVAILAALVAVALTGCVRRTLKIDTEPQGAVIWLNDEEIGRSPVETDFVWYGDYDVVARKEGFQTLQTHWQVDAPWYQTPFVDFFFEALYPGEIHDVHATTFELQPEQLPSTEELLDRAGEFRERTLFESE